MYIEFENKKIALSNGEQIGIIAELASCYHNALVHENLKGEKDLYGNSYTPDDWPEPQPISSDVPEPKIKVTHRNFEKDHWDEELNGERVVYDSSYEINEDLVPWKMEKDWEEKYGLYQ